MSNINSIILEDLRQPARNFIHDIKHNPDRAATKAINLAGVAAALYHVYANSKDKPDKLSAAINSLPAAVMKGLAVTMSAHALRDLGRGNYSYDTTQNPLLKYKGMSTNNSFNTSKSNHKK